MKVERFFHTIVATNNTEKLVENRKCDDGEDVEQFIRKAL